MKKKSIISLVLAMLVTSVFSGCGAADTTGEAVYSTEIGSVSNAEDAEVDDGVVSLKIWCDDIELEVYEEIVNKFVAEHESEAQFEIVFEHIGVGDCKDILLRDVNNAADIFVFPDDQLLALVTSGVLEPIENSEEIKDLYLEGAIEAGSVNGDMYAYPLTADNGYFLYYDKNYFTEEDVESLDRILEICAENEKKFVMDWTSGWYLYSFFGSTGLEVGMNADGLTNYCNWNTTEGNIKGVDVANAMLAIATHPGFLARTDFGNAAQEGVAIAGVSGVWDISGVTAAFGKNYGACKLPTYTCAGQQVQMSSFKGYHLIGVNSYSQDSQWAAKLAEYITNEENQLLRFELKQRGPANKNAAASEAINQVPAIAAVIEQSEYGQLQQIGAAYWTPMIDFGTVLSQGNLHGRPMQELLDTLVEGITEQ